MEHDVRATTSAGRVTADEEDGEEVLSPLKQASQDSKQDPPKKHCSRELFPRRQGETRTLAKKRKPKDSGSSTSRTPDLNQPSTNNLALVPAGLVLNRVHQLGTGEYDGTKSDEMLKKQKRGENTQSARSTAAVGDSLRRAQ